jgi:hypothetical protein
MYDSPQKPVMLREHKIVVKIDHVLCETCEVSPVTGHGNIETMGKLYIVVGLQTLPRYCQCQQRNFKP